MAPYPRRRLIHLPPTLVLLIALAVGSLGFVLWLGLRWVVVLGSLVICTAAIAAWQRQITHHKRLSLATANSANLLNRDVFIAHIGHLEHQFPDISQALWCSARKQAEAIQQVAVDIAQKEATLIPELLEALHTILNLVEQLAQALKAVKQVKTYHYQQLAQQQLHSSQRRLQHTHDQLQALCDRMTLDTLQRQASTSVSEVNTWLQTLILDNENGILGE
jgi:hypothetical protein